MNTGTFLSQTFLHASNRWFQPIMTFWPVLVEIRNGRHSIIQYFWIEAMSLSMSSVVIVRGLFGSFTSSVSLRYSIFIYSSLEILHCTSRQKFSESCLDRRVFQKTL